MKRQIRRGCFETNSSSTHAICIAKDGYEKAVDDFYRRIKKYMETTEQATYIDEINNGNDNYSAMTIYDYVDVLANELKVGEQNE